tara:strand:- start:726 stop:1196 length:471 start_codon:yes stop_codon:yes gene_type:complete
MKEWFTGSGEKIAFDEIINIILVHKDDSGSISIGTDSFIKKQDCIFSIAICLFGADSQQGGRYFIKRTILKRNIFTSLMQRILAEVQKSVDLGIRLLEIIPVLDIEIHLDISASDKNQGTSRYADMLTGYAKGAGFSCKIKPDAYAATSVADKHSK